MQRISKLNCHGSSNIKYFTQKLGAMIRTLGNRLHYEILIMEMGTKKINFFFLNQKIHIKLYKYIRNLFFNNYHLTYSFDTL